MGWGSFVSSVTSTVSAVVAKPLAPSSITAVAPLFVGVPPSIALSGGIQLAAQTVTSEFANANSFFKNQLSKSNTAQKTIVSQVKQDRVIAQGVRDLNAPKSKENRQKMAVVGGIAVVVVVVAVVCVYSLGTACAPAITLGSALVGGIAAQDSKYKAEQQAKKDDAYINAQNAANANNAGLPAGETSGGGGGGGAGDLLSGNFSGVGSSLDPYTLAGRKTLMVIGGVAVVGIVTFAGFRYFTR